MEMSHLKSRNQQISRNNGQNAYLEVTLPVTSENRCKAPQSPVQKTPKMKGRKSVKKSRPKNVNVVVKKPENNSSAQQKPDESEKLPPPTTSLIEPPFVTSLRRKSSPIEGDFKELRSTLQNSASSNDLEELPAAAAASSSTNDNEVGTEPEEASLSPNVVSNLMKAKKDWTPPNWDALMDQMKEEGRDAASMDADLKDIMHDKSDEQKGTGKYLMPEDITWCRGRTKFAERDLVAWFKRFRKEVGAARDNRINLKGFAKLFNMGFPNSDVEALNDFIREVYLNKLKAHKFTLDFKDAIKLLDSVTCKTQRDKLQWACSLIAPGNVPLQQRHLPVLIKAMDLVQFDGFLNGATDEEILDRAIKQRNATTLDNKRRVDEVIEWAEEHEAIDHNSGNIERECILSIPELIIYAKF